MDYYIGSIIPTAVNYAPDGWALCLGQQLLVQQYTALFSLIGNRFGGDGRTTFNLPNLQGYCLVGQSTPVGSSQFNIGLPMFGTINPVAPPHIHNAAVTAATSGGTLSLQASASAATSSTPANNLIPAASVAVDNSGGGGVPDIYSFGTNANAVGIPDITVSGTVTQLPSLALASTAQVGSNMQPFVAINFQIALEGIYPVRPN